MVLDFEAPELYTLILHGEISGQARQTPHGNKGQTQGTLINSISSKALTGTN